MSDEVRTTPDGIIAALSKAPYPILSRLTIDLTGAPYTRTRLAGIIRKVNRVEPGRNA